MRVILWCRVLIVIVSHGAGARILTNISKWKIPTTHFFLLPPNLTQLPFVTTQNKFYGFTPTLRHKSKKYPNFSGLKWINLLNHGHCQVLNTMATKIYFVSMSAVITDIKFHKVDKQLKVKIMIKFVTNSIIQ